MSVREEHPSNRLALMTVTPFGILMLTSDEQPSKAPTRIRDTDCGIVIFVTFFALAKQL